MSYLTGSGDLYGLSNLGKIVCPDCGKAYLQKLQKDPSQLICSKCFLVIPDTELTEENMIVPQSDMGISIHHKPYFNQIGANEVYHERGNTADAFSLDTMSNKAILDQYSLSSLAFKKTGGMKIHNKRGRKTTYGKEEESIQAVKKLMKGMGTDIKVELT